MAGGRSRLGWRGLAGLAISGAAVGFTVPAIGSSLAQRERRQPAIRLLPAPRVPPSETQPSPSDTGPASSVPSLPVRPLGPSRAELQSLRREQRTHHIVAVPQKVEAPTSSDSPTPSTSSAPPKATKKAALKEEGSKEKGPKATTGPVNGGTPAPTTTSSKQKMQ